MKNRPSKPKDRSCVKVTDISEYPITIRKIAIEVLAALPLDQVSVLGIFQFMAEVVQCANTLLLLGIIEATEGEADEQYPN